MSAMKKPLSLYELNALVRETIEVDMPDSYWVQAELSDVRESYGHCYMELIQKDEASRTPIARARANCWRNRWMLIRPAFERLTGQGLRSGMKVMLQVHAQFHENFGFSWIVDDIDATYTMGDMARRRQEIIARLRAEGVFDLQKELRLPLFTQRVAVVSSASAAGYGDFADQLAANDYGFCFHTELFTATMQGEQVEQSVIAALDAINARAGEFDVVVIIRGGGTTSDLSGFDTLALAENVANFPLPVITGIGHERDESVLDMVAHTRVKTPTAAAAFLVARLADVEARIDGAGERMVRVVRLRMERERMRIDKLASAIPLQFSLVRSRGEARLNVLQSRLVQLVDNRLERAAHRLQLVGRDLQPLLERRLQAETHRLALLGQRVEALNPDRLLRRGYSITLHEGRVVRDPRQLSAGDMIETRLEKGILKSRIES